MVELLQPAHTSNATTVGSRGPSALKRLLFDVFPFVDVPEDFENACETSIMTSALANSLSAAFSTPKRA